jgi:hypothetical protein
MRLKNGALALEANLETPKKLQGIAKKKALSFLAPTQKPERNASSSV